MRGGMLSLAIGLAAMAVPAVSQEIAAGARITVVSDWHAKNGGPYRPRVVSCKAASGLCLRDDRLSPAERPMTRTGQGLQVVFGEWGVVYLFRPNGKGSFHDRSGKRTGVFTWSQ